MTHYKDYDLYYQFNQDSFYVKAIDTNTFMSYENTIDYILFAYKQSNVKNIFDNLLTDKNICIDFIIISNMLTMKCSYCNEVVDITFDLILNYTEIDEKSIMITKLMEENKKLQLEKNDIKLIYHSSLPQLKWELELETILKTFLNPERAYVDINSFKNDTNYHNSLNKNFTEISNSIKNIETNEIIYSICYYSYTFHYNKLCTYIKFFLITNKNIYKLQIVSPEKNNIKVDSAPDCMIIPNNAIQYGGMSESNFYKFIKCKSINDYTSLATIERYIKHTRGDKTSYRFMRQMESSMNLCHDNHTMQKYLNDLESSLVSLF